MRLAETGALCVLCGAFFLFSHNSGYGYDALEHLVIGRSLLDGYQLYDFIPSRSFGIYALVAAFLGLGGLHGHVGAALLTTLIFAGFVVTTRLVVARHFDQATARLAAILVAAAAAFMEMNFLLAEGPVLIVGLVGYHLLLRRPEPGVRDALLAGLAMGAGAVFKSVAAFYVVGAMLWLLLPIAGAARTGPLRFRHAFMLGMGALLPVVLPALYFAATGRLPEHLQWTYVFPLLHFPANTVFLTKLLVKTSWFIVLVLACGAAALGWPRVRRELAREPATLLALAMGAIACLALLKQQASHDFFPGAGLLAVFAARVLRLTVGARPSDWRLLVAGAAAALVVVAGVASYRPDAIARLTTVRDFSHEQGVRDALTARVPEGHAAVFFHDSLRLYWLSHRYPNVPFLKVDVQELHWLAERPEALTRALRADSLALVGLDDRGVGIEDGRYDSRALNAQVRREVETRFVPLPDAIAGRRLWLPISEGAHAP